TRFDVDRLEGRPPRVVLVEGHVQVTAQSGAWHQALSAPGEAVFPSESGSPQIVRLDAEAATSWTVGRLTFRGTPLADAVAEVNRYSRKEIVLEAPDLRSL